MPIDYPSPSRGSFPLAVIEHPVPHSRGVIVFNPGGPGESGVLILPILASFVPSSVRSQFTLVSFDERGTGSSDPLLSAAPLRRKPVVRAADRHPPPRLLRDWIDRAVPIIQKLFPSVDTTTSARDMNSLRLALGVDRINYYGLSYGTVLGSVLPAVVPHPCPFNGPRWGGRRQLEPVHGRDT